MVRTTRFAVSLPLLVLALGCDATEPKSASADTPVAAGSEHKDGETHGGPAVDEPPKTPTVPAVAPVEPKPPTPPVDPVTSPEPSGGPGVPLPFATPPIVKHAAAMAEATRRGRIPRESLEGANASLAVLHLAQTAEDPEVAGAALKALSGLYWSRKHDKRRTVDGDYVAVVVRRLASDEPRVLEGALKAAETAADVEPPDPTLVAALLERAEPGQPPDARVMAYGSLAGIKPLTGKIQEALLKGLSDEDPRMVALTLSSLYLYTDRFTDRATLVAQLREMTSSQHAGVRAKALAGLANVERGTAHREATTALALKMLEDEHPLVRGEAVYALGSMRQVEYADKVVGMMGDEAEVGMRIDGWSQLDGSSADKRMAAPGGQTVTGTALLSLAILSTATESKFEYVDLIDRKTLGQPNHDAAVVAAKAWLKAHGAE